MGKKKKNSKIVKSLTVAALSSSIILGSLGNAPTISNAANFSKVEDILAKLTPEQRAALKQLSTNQATGLQLPSTINLDSSDETNVIIEFKNKPSKVAKLEAEVNGKQLSESEASKLVDQDHATFQQDLPNILLDKNNKKVNFKIKRSYKHAFNGVSLKLPANQIKNLLKSNAVQTVWSNEEFSIDPPTQGNSNTPKADEANLANYTPYDGLDRLHKEGFTGKGIKIGILDTGMDYHHPDLKDAYKGGYDFVDNDNDPMETTYADWVKAGKPGSSNGADYYTEHGTHVAGIIGGRGAADSEYKTIGAAPEADLYAYRVLGPGGHGMSDGIIAALDKAVEDGMDVLNMSLGASINDPMYATSIAVNNAVLNGVTTVVAAGNSGNNMYTLGSPGAAALALTVGASSIAIDIYQYEGVNNGNNYTLRELAKNYTDDLKTLKGQTYQLVDVGLGSPSNFSGKDLNGKIAYIQRGSFALIDKIKNAKEHGAIGVIMANNAENQEEGSIQSFLGESVDAIPSFSVSYENGQAITAALNSGKMDFTFGDFSQLKTAGDELASFSSRGPSRLNYDIKPEITAPGVSILSTVPFYINNNEADGSKPEDYQYAYERLSGTSMATPYVAGVSALLLQENKDLQPEDVKAILMNTADPLSKDYSVFEVGSGRVDAYEAVHSNVEIEVSDKTPTIINGKQKSVKELTGAMSFGAFPFENQDISDDRNVTLKNSSTTDKNFNVEVHFQSGLRDSLDASKNNVTLEGPASVNLNGKSQKNIKFKLNIPKTAEKGTYEGYVVFTNNADPTEEYQIPFGVRVVHEGFGTFTAVNPIFSTNSFIYPFVDAKFSLNSYMNSLDVVLQDATTGEDIGLVGSFTTPIIAENTEYYVSKIFSGAYYPFTGDANNPISSDYEMIQPGHYKLKLIGTSESGKTFTVAQDIINEVAPPTISSNYDDLDQKVIEYDESQLDSNGQVLFPFSLHVNDPEIDEATKYGIQQDQSDNQVGGLYGRLPFGFYHTDKNGDYKDQILVDSKSPFAAVNFFALDAAQNQSSLIRVAYTKNTTPYYYLKANKQSVTTGDTVTYTVRSNNIKKLKTSTFTITANNNWDVLEHVKVNDDVKQYGDASLDVQTAPIGTNSTRYTMTFTYLGDTPLPEDLALFNFDMTIQDKGYFPAVPEFASQINASTTNQENVVTTKANVYIEFPNYKPTISRFSGQLRLEGTINPETNSTNYAIDQRLIGAKVTATSFDGKNVYEGTILKKTGGYELDGIPAAKDPYTLKVDVPGHFTVSQPLLLSHNIRGEVVGSSFTSWDINLTQAAAGDTNKDNVIDILDALSVQKYWGTDNASADLNFDKVVDGKDMDYIMKNFGLQNSTVKDAPKAKSTYKGVKLDDILTQLGLK